MDEVDDEVLYELSLSLSLSLRMDEVDDEVFYEQPRLVTHIDDKAIAVCVCACMFVICSCLCHQRARMCELKLYYCIHVDDVSTFECLIRVNACMSMTYLPLNYIH